MQLPPKQPSSAYGRAWKAGQYPERTSIISCFLYISFKTNVSSSKIDQIHQKEDAEPCEEIQQIHPAAFQKHAVQPVHGGHAQESNDHRVHHGQSEQDEKLLSDRLAEAAVADAQTA